MTEVRPFHRSDREQLADLVNAHIAAVVPGWSISVAALLAQLERDPAEYVVDPWVVDRASLVALSRDRVVAAAHLKRYSTDSRVTPDYHGAGEIAWLVCWPHTTEAGCALAEACVQQLDAWAVTRMWADGAIPTPATYGIPDAWPHVREVLGHAGFRDDDSRTEILVAGDLDGTAVAAPEPPIDGLAVRREVGNLATRFAAVLDDGVIGYVHVRDALARGGALAPMGGWAELWELHVEPERRRLGVATWLLGEMARWLRLGGTTRVLAHVSPDFAEIDMLAFYARFGWHEIGRTSRGWKREIPARP